MLQLSCKGPSFFNCMDCIHVYSPLIHSLTHTRNKANPVTTNFFCLFIQVLGELGCVTVISAGVFVFIITCEEALPV